MLYFGCGKKFLLENLQIRIFTAKRDNMQYYIHQYVQYSPVQSTAYDICCLGCCTYSLMAVYSKCTLIVQCTTCDMCYMRYCTIHYWSCTTSNTYTIVYIYNTYTFIVQCTVYDI